MTTLESAEDPGPKIAVIGSGPSGCYTAQFLRKELPDAEISVFEALPVPYGLVRYGVAADHQGTKAVAQQFDRMFQRSGITFVGNVRIGVDVGFETIAGAFDIVVVATGLSHDRPLPIPRDEAAHVIGAGRLLRALNAFPDTTRLHRLGNDLVVVGHGNVAIDVVRLLTKRPDQLVGSDIDDGVLGLLRPAPPSSVRLVGRSSAANAKFDLAMLRELCTLDSVLVRAEGIEGAAPNPVADLLREHRTRKSPEATVVTFHFGSVPTAVRHEAGRTILDVTCPTGQTKSLPADTVITAIGFCGADDEPVDAWSGAHVYRVGWLDRGGRGNIAENRKHAQAVAKSIAADVTGERPPRRRSAGLAGVLPHLRRPAVGFTGWRAIDETERRTASPQRCRRKITDLGEMVAIARTAS